jgi:hypothetical protein
VAASLRQQQREHGRVARLVRLIELAEGIASKPNGTGLEDLFASLRLEARRQDAGVLLVIDELGKLLEYAAQRPDTEDIFLLQRLAERASRSDDLPFLVLGLLHHGFHAYAERLPSSVRYEWEKVAGRFDELVFDQPLVHTAALVSGALNIDTHRLPKPVRDAATDAARETAATGWLGGATTGAATLDATRFYPLHPTLIPVLVRFFARFGQNERSLFSFLLSSEPFGLQAFCSRSIDPASWYRLHDLYDYIRANFGHRLSGVGYRTHWTRITETLDSASPMTLVANRVLKTVAVLNLLDADDLLATDRALDAALGPKRVKATKGVAKQLLERGLLFRRGAARGYRLWPNSSMNLDHAFASASRVIGPVESVASAVEPLIDRDPLPARRHYVERGTLRYFEIRLCRPRALIEALSEPADADGIVIVALVDTPAEREEAIAIASASPFDKRSDILISVSQPLLGIAPEVQDVRRWDWIASNTPELVDDSFATAEVGRQQIAARRALATRLIPLLGLRSRSSVVTWLREGCVVQPPDRGGLATLLSDVCDELYPDAPRITNELLNRNALSSAAAAARARLIEGLLSAADQPLLGIDASKAPPEKSMYLSVIAKGGVHIRDRSGCRVVEPAPGHDPLRLLPSLDYLVTRIEAAKDSRVCVETLLTGLKRPPYGVRAGVAPLLLAILLRTRAHELAVYEQGTFLHTFGPSDFLRLTKSPSSFELQHCEIKGVRVEVFELLAAAFAPRTADRNPQILDVVRPLCEFAAQLPEYTRRATALNSHALSVRAVLMSAREPFSLLFRELPEACGVGSFTPDEPATQDRVRTFVQRLVDAIGELRAAYSHLLTRIVNQVATAIGEPQIDRARLAARAVRISLAAKDSRIRTFALRLGDPALTLDAWAEALASFVTSKPPSRWSPTDEAKFVDDVTSLMNLFFRIEAVAFASNRDRPALELIRVNLTRGDGEDLVRVIEPRAAEGDLAVVADTFYGLLPQDPHSRLDVLTRLLWKELSIIGKDSVSHVQDDSTLRQA